MGVKELKLFEIIPEKFFSVLSSSKKEIYSDCLFILYRELKANTSFGIDREVVTDTFMDYFESLKDENLFAEEDETVRTSRDKANFVVRKLIECKWIDLEITTSYRQIINFEDYAVAFLETMEKLINNEKLEYQGYVYTIYSILMGSEDIQKSVMLEQVYDNTNRLMIGLKTLNSNIKKYIEKITQQKSADEIMKLHFEGYTQEISDKGYHRLKTSDNVSKFRPRIIQRLEEYKKDRDFLDQVCKENIEMEKYANYESASEDILFRLNHIIFSFSNMDEIIKEIDRKNTQYIRASLTRVKYLLNTAKDLAGQVTEILKYIVFSVERDHLEIKEDTIDDLAELFGFYPQSFIDEKSIYTPADNKGAFIPQSLESQNELTKEERERKIKEVMEKNKMRMSRENIDNFVLAVLKKKKVINASFLPLNEVKDYLRIIYILIYSKSRLVHYKIKRLENIVNLNGFSFHDFEIWRK